MSPASLPPMAPGLSSGLVMVVGTRNSNLSMWAVAVSISKPARAARFHGGPVGQQHQHKPGLDDPGLGRWLLQGDQPCQWQMPGHRRRNDGRLTDAVLGQRRQQQPAMPVCGSLIGDARHVCTPLDGCQQYPGSLFAQRRQA
jgi:hypothetical protein